jgi:hypothetical protein
MGRQAQHFTATTPSIKASRPYKRVSPTQKLEATGTRMVGHMSDCRYAEHADTWFLLLLYQSDSGLADGDANVVEHLKRPDITCSQAPGKERLDGVMRVVDGGGGACMAHRTNTTGATARRALEVCVSGMALKQCRKLRISRTVV